MVKLAFSFLELFVKYTRLFERLWDVRSYEPFWIFWVGFLTKTTSPLLISLNLVCLLLKLRLVSCLLLDSDEYLDEEVRRDVLCSLQALLFNV